MQLKCQFDENRHHFFFRIFWHRIANLSVKYAWMQRKLNITIVQVEKNCYKLTNFSTAINQNRFQLSPQFNSSRSSYDVILVTFQNFSQSKYPEAMDFALLQVNWESISKMLTPKWKLSMLWISTRTISGSDASRPHNKSSCKTEQTRGCRSIAPASVRSWRNGAGMFSNKVDLMETLMSLVVCRTLFLLLRYSVVGTTIKLWNCLG